MSAQPAGGGSGRQAVRLPPLFFAAFGVAGLALGAGVLGLFAPTVVPALSDPAVAWSCIGVGVVLEGWGASMLLAALIVGYSLYRNRTDAPRTELIVLSSILAVVMLQVVVQHIVLDVPYPSGRTALFLFLLVIWILASALRDTVFPKRIGRIVCTLIVALQMFHVGNTLNFSHTSEWAYCADVRNAILVVKAKAEVEKNAYGGVVLGYDNEFGNIINYYLQLEGLRNVSRVQCSETEDADADFYIVSPYGKHAIAAADTLLQYEPSELLILQSTTHAERVIDLNSETTSDPTIDLPDAATNRELYRYVYRGADTVSARVDLQCELVFTAPKTQCVVQFWHNRGDSLLWCGYYFIEAWPGDLVGRQIINRNLPNKLAPNDVIHASAVPFESPGGPIEISQIKAHLQLSR